MTRGEYLKSLRQNLSHLPNAEVDDVVRDQEEYINDAVRGGRSEADVLQGLGDPKVFAQSLTAENKIQQARTTAELGPKLKHTFSALLAILALAPFNLIFVLGPLCALLGVLIAAWTLSGVTALVSLLLLMIYPFKFLVMSLGFWTHVGGFFFVLGSLFAGIFAVLAMVKITQWFLQGLLSYLNWNLNFIRGKAA